MAVETIGQRSRTVTESGRKAVANAALELEAFARRLHHRYSPAELPVAGAYRFTARYHVSLVVLLTSTTYNSTTIAPILTVTIEH